MSDICPRCKENRQDYLVWLDDDIIECASCRTRYFVDGTPVLHRMLAAYDRKLITASECFTRLSTYFLDEGISSIAALRLAIHGAPELGFHQKLSAFCAVTEAI